MRPSDRSAPATSQYSVQRGRPFSVTVTVHDGRGVPVDVSGVTLAAELRDRQDPESTVQATPTVTVLSAAGGVIEVTMSSSTTSNLVPGVTPAFLDVTMSGAVTGGQAASILNGWVTVE